MALVTRSPSSVNKTVVSRDRMAVTSVAATVPSLPAGLQLHRTCTQSCMRRGMELISGVVPKTEGIPATPTHNTTALTSFSSPAGCLESAVDLQALFTNGNSREILFLSLIKE
jgi:hypothetical protein